jgi:hypothetical protein
MPKCGGPTHCYWELILKERKQKYLNTIRHKVVKCKPTCEGIGRVKMNEDLKINNYTHPIIQQNNLSGVKN